MYNKKGQALIAYAVLIVVLIGITGIVVDASLLYIDRNKLQSIADQAAIGGAAKLSDGAGISIDKAYEITEANGLDDSAVSVNTPYTITDNPDDPRYEASDLSIDPSYLIRVKVQKMHQYTFGSIFGLTQRLMTAESIGVSPGPVVSVNGITPLAVKDQTYNYGQTYDIKANGGTENSNRGSMRLGGTGADNWRDNMKYGYDGIVSVGNNVNTEPGRNAGPTKQSVDYLMNDDPTGTFENHSKTSSKLLVVMVTDPDPTTEEGTKPVTVLKFLFFWLEGEGFQSSIQAKYIGEAKVGSWGQAEINGINGSYAHLIK